MSESMCEECNKKYVSTEPSKYCRSCGVSLLGEEAPRCGRSGRTAGSIAWISVKERLPEVGAAVLACRKIHDDEQGFKEWWFGCCVYREWGFPWVTFDDPNPVEYWMLLPEPPKQ